MAARHRNVIIYNLPVIVGSLGTATAVADRLLPMIMVTTITGDSSKNGSRRRPTKYVKQYEECVRKTPHVVTTILAPLNFGCQVNCIPS